MNFSPATWQLMVTFTPRTVLMVPPMSTVMAGSLVLSTVIRDVFTNGFPEDGEKCEILYAMTIDLRHSLESWDNEE